jgi:pyruvate dehydrogenase E1 component beta subunit
LLSLLAPVQRVTGYDTVMPSHRLEKHYIPDTARIVKAVKETLEFA